MQLLAYHQKKRKKNEALIAAVGFQNFTFSKRINFQQNALHVASKIRTYFQTNAFGKYNYIFLANNKSL